MTTTERAAPAGPPGVLRTRLLPPRLPPNAVARAALVERVHRGFGGRVLALVAGAGYGKTTLLVQALETSPTPWVWLSCDARLRSPLTSTAERRPSPPSPTDTTFQPSAERVLSTSDMEDASAVSTAYLSLIHI